MHNDFEVTPAMRRRWARRQFWRDMREAATFFGLMGALIGGSVYFDTIPGQIMVAAWRHYVG